MMPRYFFNVQNGVRLVNDRHGKELDDVDAAREEATKLATAIRNEFVTANPLIDQLSVEISDDSGTVLDKVPLNQTTLLDFGR